ncbi:DUF397 domain-containing protein [Streptomyces sp. NPDC018833]|uniref:DUF397 domain-containing protein n=1 Tax=Streptomyces sp. NPDC018833 TaxID=3365053 RepID=UPI0037AD2F24
MTAYAWQKSSYCGEGDACVNVAADASGVRLTESSDPSGAILHTTPAAFAALTHALKTGMPSLHIDVTHTPDGLVRVGGIVTTTHENGTRSCWASEPASSTTTGGTGHDAAASTRFGDVIVIVLSERSFMDTTRPSIEPQHNSEGRQPSSHILRLTSPGDRNPPTPSQAPAPT